MMPIVRVADLLIGRPLLVDPAKADIVLRILDGRLSVSGRDGEKLPIDIAAMDPLSPDASRFIGSYMREARPYGLVKQTNGIGILTIDGALVNRGAYIGASSGLVSYEGITAQINDVANDKEIKALVIDMNSPGGHASGMATLAGKIRELAAQKPVVTVVNDVAASAAYGLASGSTEIVVSETSIVGSIGVIMVHLDHSEKLAKKGIKPTILHAGARKPEGHPAIPLTDAARANMQAMIDSIYENFLGVIEGGRGSRMTREMARATEAGVFLGSEAVKAGLADRVGSIEETIARLAQGNGRHRASRNEAEGATMTTQSNVQANSAAQAETQPPAAGASAPDVAAITRAAAEAATARVQGILGSEEAKGREALAQHLAFKTDMSVENAVATLKAAAPAAQPAASYAEGKAAAGALNLAGLQPASQSPAASWDSIINNLNADVESVA